MGFVTFSPAPLRVASKVFFEAAPTVPELVCSTAWIDAAQVVAGATTKMSEKNGDPVQEVVAHTRGFGASTVPPEPTPWTTASPVLELL
jgi:hypothetical protein